MVRSSRGQQRTPWNQHERVGAVVAAIADDGPRIVDPVAIGKLPPGVLGEHFVEVRYGAVLPEHGTDNVGGIALDTSLVHRLANDLRGTVDRVCVAAGDRAAVA